MKPILLIATFDRYNEVCEVTLSSLQPLIDLFEIVVLTNEQFTAPSYVNQLVADEDLGWSANILDFIKGVDESRQIFLWMDDLILTDIYALEEIPKIIEAHQELEMDYLSVYCPPWEQIYRRICFFDKYVPVNASSSLYPISCMCSIFRASFLRSLLRANESAWEFEKNARDKLIPVISSSSPVMYQLRDTPFNVTNIIVKGKVADWRMSESDISTSFPSFSRMSRIDCFFYKLKVIAFSFFRLPISRLFRFLIS